MFSGLLDVEGWPGLVSPFLLMGNAHDSLGEGGEQGMMCFHWATGPCWRSSRSCERESTCSRIWTMYPESRCGLCFHARTHWWAHSRVRVHTGKTQVWNSEGIRPNACDAGTHCCGNRSPCKGLERSGAEQGMKILGIPLGHPSFVCPFAEEVS